MHFHHSKKWLVMAVVTMAAFNSFGQNSVNVDVKGAKTVVPQEVFGLLMETLGRQWDGGPQKKGGIFVGTSSSIENVDGMRQDVIDAFKECGVGAVQWPGGCAANGYNWVDNKRPSNNVGVDRFIKFCKLTEAEAMISGKAKGVDAGSNFAFASYIIDSLDYPLKWFKFGNEIWGCGGNISVNDYMGFYKTNYDRLVALRNTENGKNLKFIAAAGAIEGNYNWIPTYLSTLGSSAEAFEFHDYIYHPKAADNFSSANPTTQNYWTIMKGIFDDDVHKNFFTHIFPKMDATDPTKRVIACVDEWGNWLAPDPANDDGWMQVVTVMDAIAVGAQLNLFVQYCDRTAIACLAQGVSCINSILNINTKEQMVKTPAFYVFKMYLPHHRNNAKFLPLSAPAIEKVNNLPAVDVAATVDDSGIVNISFVNIDLTATRKVTVTLTTDITTYTVKSAEIVTGTNLNSTNPFGEAEQVNIKPLEQSAYSVAGKVLTVTLPSKSVSMIRLAPPAGTAVLPVSPKNRVADAFSVKAGSNGTVQISSSVSRKTPVTISLFGSNGRVLVDKTAKTFLNNNTNVVLGNSISKGVYLVKITGENLNLTKHVVIVR